MHILSASTYQMPQFQTRFIAAGNSRGKDTTVIIRPRAIGHVGAGRAHRLVGLARRQARAGDRDGLVVSRK